MAGPYDALNSFLSGEAIAALNEAANQAVGNIVTSQIFAGATIPAANTVPAGRMVFNTSTNAPQWSNGTNWYDADGNLT